MTRLARVTVEYDGSAYAGWQVQNNAVSVQEKMETALERLTGTAARVRAAGRTDAGVHARGQVAAFPVPAAFPIEKLAEAMNSRLPDDIAVVAAREADAGFDPRRHCVMKQYSYSFAAGRLRPALAQKRCWHVKWPLDLAAMQTAASAFVGTHDFTSFANQERAGEDNIRTVDRCELISLADDYAGRRQVVLYIEGRSFLYNMVRAIAGTLVGVGAGRFSPGEIPALLAAKSRAVAGQSAPACGLCLEWVLYPGDEKPVDRGGLF
ncbi:MAG: tRNA pseudouridine(38-40) synthase TruA [Planctomycetes bacterium]|nr:tRNA pseudouridine(38-40) synthase TruA [Planctomycetota bacterium]